jgi:hypothetical protein
VTYEVVDNVPIPTSVRSKNGSDKYDWDRLEKVNQSIFVPETEADEGDTDLKKLRRRVFNAARAYGRPKGKKFVAMIVTEQRTKTVFQDGEDMGQATIDVRGVRCWLQSIEDGQDGVHLS